MKFNRFFKVASMALLLGLVACNRQEPEIGGNQTIESDGKEGTPVEVLLTAEETTERLSSTAQQIINTFNTEDQRATIEFAEPFVYELINYSYDWAAFEEYFDGRYDAIWAMPRYALDVARGKSLASQASDFIFSFKNESVTFEADDVTKTWVCKGPNSDNSIQFIYTVNGKKCIAKLWGEGKITTHTVNVQWDEYVDGYYDETTNEWINNYETKSKTYTAEIPERIIFTLSDGTTEYIRVIVSVELKKNESLYYSIEGKVANLAWKSSAKVTSTNAACAMSFNYGAKNLFAIEGTIPSYVVLNKEDNQTWEEWIELYGEQYEELLKKAGSVSAKAYLLDQAQIIAKVDKPNNFYTAYRDWDNQYYHWEEDKQWWEQSHYQLDANLALADVYNNNSYLGIYYNSDIEQARVKVEAREFSESQPDYNDPDGYWSDDYMTWLGDYIYYTYYDVIPVLYFPKDGTTYEFEQYYNSNKDTFESLLNPIKTLINQYIDLLEYFNIDPITLQ